MKKRMLTLFAALLLSVSIIPLSGCGDTLKNAEQKVNSTLGDLDSKIKDNPLTSTYNEATSKETEYDAKKLNDVLKNFYSAVSTGTINEDTDGRNVTAQLPPANAAAAQKKEAAKSLTVLSALEQQGMQAHFTEEYMENFLYGDKKVVYKNSSNEKEYKALTLETPLGDIFG